MIILLSLLNTILAGHIQIWDIQLDYTNQGYATEFTFPFRLDNDLPSFGFVKVVFPFSLHYTSTNSQPDNVVGAYKKAIGDYACGVEIELSLNIFITSDESNSYYLQFLDSKKQPIGLLAKTFYYGIVRISGNNLNIQSAGVKNPLQLYSVTSLSKLAMIIDYNPSAHTFALSNDPFQEMQVGITFNGKSKIKMNDLYEIQVSALFKKNMPEGSRIKIILSNGFTFETSCGLQNTKWKSTCQFESTVATFWVNTGIIINDQLIFKLQIRNPNKVTPATAIQVRSLPLYSNKIIEIANSDKLLEVPQLQLSSHKLQLGWGLEYSSRSAYFYPFPVIIYRGNSKVNVYNGIKWIFQLGEDLPEDIKLQIEIQTPMKYNSYIMTGSINHNLPPYSGQSVQCYFSGIQKLAESKIICKNVGQLYNSISYFVGCRVTFPYDQFNLPLESKFGTLNIFSLLDDVIQTLSITKESNPVDYIQTSNNPDWTVSSHVRQLDGTIVSTQLATESMADPTTTKLGILPNLDDGEIELHRIIFNLAILIKDITSITSTPAVPSQNVPYSAGLVIIANHNILTTSTDPPILEVSSADSSQWFRYDYKSSNIANFLEIKVAASTIGGLLSMFAYNTDETLGQFNQFAIKNIQIKFHASQYADDYLLDFYFGIFDQIESAYPIFKNSLLNNAYTISSPQPSNIRLGIANYFTSTASGNNGDYFPTILRIAGYFSQADIENASTKLSLFFTNMQPFYENENTEINNQVTCKLTALQTPKCTYYSSGLLGNAQSYNNYERIDIEFDSIPTNADDAFQLLIPMKNIANKPQVSVFLAAVVQNPTYVGAFIQIRAIYRLTGGNNLNQNQYTFTVQSSALGTGFIKSGILLMNYNLDPLANAGITVGTNSTQLTFNIGHSDSFNIVLGNSKNADNANGGAFTLSSTAQFYTTDTSYSTSISISNSKISGCTQFSYIQSFYLSVATMKYVIFCPFEKGSESSATQLVLKSANLPFINGEKLPVKTAFTWSDATRGLGSFQIDTSTLISNTGILKIGSVNTLVRKLKQQRLIWKFSTQNPIPSQGTIKVEFGGSIIFTPINAGSRCQLVSEAYGIIDHSCTVSAVSSGSNPTISFKITNCPGCPFPAGSFILYEWGVDNQDSVGTKVSFHMRILSEQLNTIDVSKVMSSLDYYNVATDPEFFFGNTDFQFYNRRARGMLKIDFQPSRSIWQQEYILLDLGGFYNDNQRNKNNLKCQILDSQGHPSLLWKEVDYTLNKSASVPGVKLYPINDIIDSQTFTFKCNGIVFPYSYNPASMVASLVVQGTFSVIESSNSVALDILLPNEETNFGIKNIQLVSKSNNVGGSETDIVMNFTSTLMDISLGSTIFVIFPTTYPLIVSNNLTYCSLNDYFVACSISQENTIVLENFDININKNTAAKIRVFGAQQSSLFNSQSNEIFIGITNNKDTTILVEYGVAYDLEPQDMILAPPSSIQVQWLSLSDYFIRTMNSITYKVAFPAGSINLNNIIQVDFPPAWDMIINYKLPLCSLLDFQNVTNYAANCTNFGNRVIIYINTTDYIGSTYYYLTLSQVRNPDFAVCGINKWVITVLKADGSYVYGRSHSNSFNSPTIPFISNPDQITLKFIDPDTKSDITTLYVKTGVLLGRVALASATGAFVRSFYIYSSNSYFTTNPTNANAPMGQAYTTFNIAGTSKAPQGLQLIELQKSDDYDRHTPLPFLRVFLSQTFYTLKTETNLYTLTIGGQALPIFFNFTDMLPSSNLRVEGTISIDRIYFKSKSSVTFGPASGKMNAFLFASEDSGINVGDSGVISFTVQGVYDQYYSTIDQISFRIVDVNKKRPLSYSESVGTERGANYLTFRATCNQYGTIYYYLSINGSKILQSEEISANTLKFSEPSITDYYHQIFGLKNAFEADKNYTIQVVGLRPQTMYNITSFCLSSELRYSAPNYLIQSTKSNNGKSFYIDFYFESEIDLDFSISITCFLTVQFKVPARLVRNSVNSWCDYQRRRLLQQTTTYSEKTVRMYIGLLDYEYHDTVTQALFSSKLNKTQFIADLYNYVAGLPTLIKLSDFQAMSTQAPSFLNEDQIYIEATDKQVQLFNISLDQQGFVYAMLDWQNTTYQPTFYDVRVGNSYRIDQLLKISNATQSIHYYSQRYDESTMLSFTFEGLTRYTNYTLFFYASNDDPTEFQLRTYVHTIHFTTSPQYKMNSMILEVYILILIILSVL